MRKHRRGSPAVGSSGGSALRHDEPTGWAGESSDGDAADLPPAAGGYRLVRVLGEGASAVVYLGCVDSADEAGRRRTAAIKVYRAGAAATRADAEVAALAAVDHPHLLRLLDVASTDAGVPCLVLERCDTGGLALLVSERSSLSAGEAVTILAPLVAAVGALHRAGWVHRDIRLSNVLFAQSGAPVLCGFGDAAPIAAPPTPAGLAFDETVRADRRQLLLVVGAVLERLDDPLHVSVDDWLARHPVDADAFVAGLSEALFDLAEPQPVRLHERAGPVVAPVVRPRQAAPVENARGREPVWRSLVPVVRLVVRHARGVRRRYWTVAAGVTACLVVAVFAVPQGAVHTPSSSVRDGTETSVTTAAPGEDIPGDPVPVQTDGEPPADAAVLGDDPVAALVVLLAERQRCLHDLSVLCLDAVLQPGSAALERDVAVIRALQAGGEQTTDDTVEANGPVLVERLGDSALLDLGEVPQTQPASALVMRGEAGWRIRAYLGQVLVGD